MNRRHSVFEAKSAEHARLEEGCRWTRQACEDSVEGLRERSRQAMAAGDSARCAAILANASSMADEVQRLARLTEYHRRLKREYEKAAARPWLFVTVDRIEEKASRIEDDRLGEATSLRGGLHEGVHSENREAGIVERTGEPSTRLQPPAATRDPSRFSMRNR